MILTRKNIEYASHQRVKFGGLKETKNVSSPSTCESQYYGEPLWPRSSVLGLRPPGLEFRVLSLVHKGGLKPDSFHFISLVYWQWISLVVDSKYLDIILVIRIRGSNGGHLGFYVIKKLLEHLAKFDAFVQLVSIISPKTLTINPCWSKVSDMGPALKHNTFDILCWLECKRLMLCQMLWRPLTHC